MHGYVHIAAKCAAAKPLSDAHFCDPPEALRQFMEVFTWKSATDIQMNVADIVRNVINTIRKKDGLVRAARTAAFG